MCESEKPEKGVKENLTNFYLPKNHSAILNISEVENLWTHCTSETFDKLRTDLVAAQTFRNFTRHSLETCTTRGVRRLRRCQEMINFVRKFPPSVVRHVTINW